MKWYILCRKKFICNLLTELTARYEILSLNVKRKHTCCISKRYMITSIRYLDKKFQT